MSPNKKAHQKHIPQRICVGCREALAKRALIRVVRGPDGVKLDPTGKAAGRGAYIHARRSCWEKALRGPLSQALKTELSDSEREMLNAHGQSMESGDDDKPVSAAPGGGSA